MSTDPLAHQSDCWTPDNVRVCSNCSRGLPPNGGCKCNWVVDARVVMRMIVLHGDHQVESEAQLDPALLSAGQRFVMIDSETMLALEYEVFDFDAERNVVLVYQLSPVDTRPESASLAERLDPRQDKSSW